MKDCPRCGSNLSHYSLAEGEGYGCDGCGWVGVDVEHRSKPAKLETWHDAISRFESKFASDDTGEALRKLERVQDSTPVPTDDEPESDPEPNVERVPDAVPVPNGDEAADAAAATEPEVDHQDDEPADVDRTDDRTDEQEAADTDATEDEVDSEAQNAAEAVDDSEVQAEDDVEKVDDDVDAPDDDVDAPDDDASPEAA